MLETQDLAAQEKEETNDTSTAVGRLSFPTLKWGEWADDSGLSTIGGRNEWTEHATRVTPSWNGAKSLGALRWSYHGTSGLYPVSFPPGWIGKEPCPFTRPLPRSVQRDSRASHHMYRCIFFFCIAQLHSCDILHTKSVECIQTCFCQVKLDKCVTHSFSLSQ